MATLSGAGAAFMATGTALADAPASSEDESVPEGAGAPPAGGFGGTVEPGSMCTRDVDYGPPMGPPWERIP